LIFSTKTLKTINIKHNPELKDKNKEQKDKIKEQKNKNKEKV